MRTSAAYIVTTSALGSSKTQLWESHRPLTLGHPFQWMIEKTAQGVRVRDLSLTRKGIQPKGAQELTEEALLSGAELQIPVKGDKTLTLKIRPVVEKTPAFAAGSAGTRQRPTARSCWADSPDSEVWSRWWRWRRCRSRGCTGVDSCSTPCSPPP